jgi:glycosyltransferase involved in cell wall biosynthesis
MPVFNAVGTLSRAVGSVQNQTCQHWELIAIDDGSTDGSGDWLEARARTDPRLRVLRQPHRGLVAALTVGTAAARGDFVARMDADDESLPERFAAQTRYLEDHPPVGVVGSLVEQAPESSTGAGYAVYVEWLNSLVTTEEIGQARFIEAPFAHPSVMFRRRLLDQHDGYRAGDFPEDYELWLRWLEAGVSMAKVPRLLLRWHDSPGRLSRTDARYADRAFYQLKAGYLAQWLKRHLLPGQRLFVWGAGRVTRRRAEWLEARVPIDAYIDIDPRKQGRRHGNARVMGPEAIPPTGEVFVVGYVANRGARTLQRQYLVERGYVEGRDFLFAA